MNEIQQRLILLLILSCVIFADYGVDVSTLTTVAAFQCLVSEGYTFVTPRAWKSTGAPDTNCPITIANAWSAGMSNVDVYFFPCYTCGNPAAQLTNATTYLEGYNAMYTRMWFDVENSAIWSTNSTQNVEFFQTLLDTASEIGLNVGIYASQSQWVAIMGGWTGAASYPLWYPHYNNISNYADFITFGGWTVPYMKQYQQTTPICGASVDFNWFPPSPSPSPTPSVSPSTTPSHTPSTSASSSVSPTPSPTPSVTPTVSVTSSVTPTTTPTETPSITPTASATPSISASRSPSKSPSTTPSITPSVTPTVTPYKKAGHGTNGAVIGGVAAAAIAAGLISAGSVIGAYVFITKRKEKRASIRQAELDLADLASRLSVPDK